MKDNPAVEAVLCGDFDRDALLRACADRQVDAGVATLVLAQLAGMTKGDGRAWPSADYLAKSSVLSKRQVQRALYALADSGLAVPVGFRGRARLRHVLPQPTMTAHGQGGDDSDRDHDRDGDRDHDRDLDRPRSPKGEGGRKKGEEEPTPPPVDNTDNTHGNRHPPGNANDTPCHQCAKERKEPKMLTEAERDEADARRCPHGVIQGARVAVDGSSVNGCFDCERAARTAHTQHVVPTPL